MLNPTLLEKIKKIQKRKRMVALLAPLIFLGFGVNVFIQDGWNLGTGAFLFVPALALFAFLYNATRTSSLESFLQSEHQLLQKIYSKLDDGGVEIKFYTSDNRVYELETSKKNADEVLAELKQAFPKVEFVLDHEKTFIR